MNGRVKLSFQVGGHIHTPELPECQGNPCSKQTRYLKFKSLQLDWTRNHLVRKETLNHLAKLTISFKHDFIVDTSYSRNSFPDLLCEVSAL